MDLRGAQTRRARTRSTIWRSALKDLAEPVTTTPGGARAAARGRGPGSAAAVEVLRDPDVLAFDSVDDLLDKLWSALESEVPLSKIKRRGGGLVVESAAIGGTPEAPAYLSARRVAAPAIASAA
jgi:hypothetical protein